MYAINSIKHKKQWLSPEKWWWWLFWWLFWLFVLVDHLQMFSWFQAIHSWWIEWVWNLQCFFLLSLQPISQQRNKKWLENREMITNGFIPIEFMKDKYFVLKAVKQNGDALRYASNELKNDSICENDWWWFDGGRFESLHRCRRNALFLDGGGCLVGSIVECFNIPAMVAAFTEEHSPQYKIKHSPAYAETQRQTVTLLREALSAADANQGVPIRSYDDSDSSERSDDKWNHHGKMYVQAAL